MKNKKQIYLVFASVVVLFCVGGFFFYQNQLKPVSLESSEVTFNIPENTTSQEVLESLENQGMIKSAFFTKLMMKQENLGDIKAGIFVLDRSWTPKEILTYVNDATNAVTDEVMITITEGKWAKDIAALIEASTNVTADSLLQLWNDETYLKSLIADYEFLSEEILNQKRPVKLEGYLYPDSYYFFKETTPEDVTRVFLNAFDQHYQEHKAAIKKSSYTLDELIALSSVVQFEASKVEDMRLIAGIFENRLSQKMMLQSTVTVCYALYDYEDWLECEHKANEVQSPYNTYNNQGLPIGPICNPGIDAILAVLEPEASDYLYFMADVYGDGTVYYAKTLEEHEANCKKYLTYY